LTVARRKALDRLRRDKNFASKQSEIAYLTELDHQTVPTEEVDMIADNRLEMIFTCCHPVLDAKSQVALTLRILGGLSTEEIASAFLDKTDAMQQRITRAKRKIAAAHVPYAVPGKHELSERTDAVLRVIYLIFNEGCFASSGQELVRANLVAEAIRLVRIFCGLLPDNCEASGLMAMMLLHDSRRLARVDADGAFVPLEAQNRARWDQSKIAEGIDILSEILPKGELGPYQLQAAISAVHAQADSWAETDWAELCALYRTLYAMQPNPVVQINLAVAASFAENPTEGLRILATLDNQPKIESYQPFHAAKGDLLARAGQIQAALSSLERAIALSDNIRERDYLTAKLHLLTPR
jgi:RNA polymerase sigma-70 factor (ECF subfamily)